MSDGWRVLLVEDNPGDVGLIRDILGSDQYAAYEVVSAARLATAVQRVAEDPFDIILLDLGLPDSAGLETLSAMHGAAEGTPIVVLTGHDDESTGLAAIQKGAQDYVVKGQLSGDLLRRALRYAIERESARRSIHASQELLRTVIDNLPDAIYVKDLACRRVLSNPVDVANLGARSEEEVLGSSERLPRLPEIEHSSEVIDRSVLETGQEVREREEMLPGAEGQSRWALTSTIPLRDTQGRITGLVGISRDITEHKSISMRNALSKDVLECLNRLTIGKDTVGELLRLIQDSTGVQSVGIRLRDDDDLPYHDSIGLQPLSISAEVSPSSPGTRSALRRDVAGFRVPEQLCEAVLSGGSAPTTPPLTRGGSYYRYDTVERPVGFDDGNGHGPRHILCDGDGYGSIALVPLRAGPTILGLLTLADRRRGVLSPEAIEYFEGLGASIGVALSRWQAEEDTRQAYVRETTINDILRLALSGLPLDTMLERTLELVLATQDLELEQRGTVSLVEDDSRVLVLKASQGMPEPTLAACARVPFGTCLCGRAALSGQVQYSCEVDERHTIQCITVEPHGHYCVPIRLGDSTIGVLNCYVRAGRGHSPRLEQFLSGVANALAGVIARERLARERSRLDEQLRQSQKMEAVGQLAGGVAHDLNNMLGVINGYAQIMLDDLPTTDPVHGNISKIKRASDRSAQLTRQLLAFARREAIAPRVLDLNNSAEAMLNMLRPLVGKNISLVWRPGAPLWQVKVDPGQIDQILANLVVNARDAIAGAGTVTVETENVALDKAYCQAHVGVTPGQFVAITVRDDGCGMSKEVIERCFEPFFTTKPVGQGTGLGLATVYGITQQNGGSVDVHSEPGKGTSFRICLPRHVPEQPPAKAHAGHADTTAGTETVLLVDDQVDLLQLYRRALERLGYTVLSADTAHEALRLATVHNGQIDLLLSDVMMPGIDGRELGARLQTMSPKVRYLYMSGYAGAGLSRQGDCITDPPVLQKPFSLEELARRVRETLDSALR